MPIGLLWVRISDIVEEMRRKRIEAEMNSSGWVSADRMGSGAGAPSQFPMSPSSGSFGGGPGGPQSPGAGPQTPGLAPGPQPQVNTGPIDGWFNLEPTGQIQLQMSFVKTNADRRPVDLGLGRKGAVRQRKEEVHEMYAVRGLQVHLPHQVLYSVVTKCISKSNAETDPDEEKINHRIPHRFNPYSNMTANWCCHCGYILPFGKKNCRKCAECGLTCHAQCVHLVPDFCGMSMAVANQILEGIRVQKQRQAKATSMTERTLRPGKSSPTGTHSPSPSYSGSTSGYVQASSPRRRRRLRLCTLARLRRNDRLDRIVHHPVPLPLQRLQQQCLRLAKPHGLLREDNMATTNPRRPLRTRWLWRLSAAEVQPPRLRQCFPRLRQPSSARTTTAAATSTTAAAAATSSATASPLPSSCAAATQNPCHRNPYRHLLPCSKQITSPSQVSTQRKPLPLATDAGTGKRIGLDHFNFLAVLGKGNFGKVMLAETKRSRRLYAIKVLKRSSSSRTMRWRASGQRSVSSWLRTRERHPFLTNLHACFQTETRVYFVMEYISGGDLMLHIQRGQFGTKRAQFYAAEVCLALKYFHENGVIYRDLKLDNILLTLDGHIKIADYGLCKEDMWYGSTTSTFCGTPEFMAPEYGRAVDWWAFGVLIYQMLLQQSPFRGEDEDEIYDAILADEPLYPIHMPRDSVSILQKLLTREPDRDSAAAPLTPRRSCPSPSLEH
ncbi:hypothetical protein L7F22_012595 [Adiantum nelumboides]|nr:hypothetical protein [Adiantum nelumboides]